MKKSVVLSLCLAVLSFQSLACAFHPRPRTRAVAKVLRPRPHREKVVPIAPLLDEVWIPRHWVKVKNGRKWVPGHWAG